MRRLLLVLLGTCCLTTSIVYGKQKALDKNRDLRQGAPILGLTQVLRGISSFLNSPAFHVHFGNGNFHSRLLRQGESLVSIWAHTLPNLGGLRVSVLTTLGLCFSV